MGNTWDSNSGGYNGGLADPEMEDENILDETDATELTVEEPDNTDEPEDTDAAPSNSRTGKGARRPLRSGPTNAQIRKIVAKTIELNNTDPDTRALAASIAGVEDDVEKIVVKIMGGTRLDTDSISDLLRFSAAAASDEVDDIDLIVELADNEESLSGVWALMHQLDLIDTPRPPAKITAAAKSLLQPLRSVNEDTRALLDAAQGLLKK